MHRRQFLRATVGLGVPAAVGALSSRDGAAHPTEPSESNATTATGTSTPTPTPTEAAATPTSGYEPLGSVAVEDATEAVTTTDGETAFVAALDGFAAVDLADPADPTVLAEKRDISPPGTTQVMTGIQDVKYDDGRLLVAGPANYDPDGFHGIALYDVSDPASPELLRAYQTAYPIHNCDLSGGYAYLTGNNRDDNPLVVVDVDRDEPAEVARWSLFDHDPVWESVPVALRTLHDVFVRDGRAYLAHWDAGTWILDVSDPTAPAYVGEVSQLASGPGGTGRTRGLPRAEGTAGQRPLRRGRPVGLAPGRRQGDMELELREGGDDAGAGRSRRPERDRPLRPVGPRVAGPPGDRRPAADRRPERQRRVDDRAQLRDRRGPPLLVVVPRRRGGPRPLGPGEPRASAVLPSLVGDEFLDGATRRARRRGRRNQLRGSLAHRRGIEALHVPRRAAGDADGNLDDRVAGRDRDPADDRTNADGNRRGRTDSGRDRRSRNGGATDEDGPGFGPLAALAGVGLGTWRLLQERGEDKD
ncbi:hypothetical protein ACFQL4_26485 [Halosimplex aquaticum]